LLPGPILAPLLPIALPTPSGVGSTPLPAPTAGPAALPVPAAVAPLPEPTPEPGLRAPSTRGRSASAPGRTRSDRQEGNGADAEVPAVVPHRAPAGDGPAVAPAAADGPIVALAAAAISGSTGSAAARPNAGPGRDTSSGPAPQRRHPTPPPVVPTPAGSLVSGPPAGDPPGLAKGRAER
jgi:hypothetical protein